MSRDLEIMKYIENEMIKVNNECGEMYSKDDFRAWQDKQLELETIERIYDYLNNKYFEGEL